MNGRAVMGWDLGGAHLKAALLAEDDTLRVFLEPCPLWEGRGELARAVDRVLERAGADSEMKGVHLVGKGNILPGGAQFPHLYRYLFVACPSAD